MFRLGRFPWVRLVGVLDKLDTIFGRDAPIRVNEAGFKFLHAITFDREPLVGEIVVLPVVIADSNHLLQGQTVVDREDDEFGHQECEEFGQLARGCVCFHVRNAV